MLRPFEQLPDESAPRRGSGRRSSLATLGLALAIICGLALTAIVGASFSFSIAHARVIRFPTPNVRIAEAAGSTGRVGQPVTLQIAVLAGRELGFRWDFGDGTTATTTTTSTTHTYATYGGYTVIVTARDPLGQTASTQTTINVLPAPPVAAFTMQSFPEFGSGICVQFDASGSVGIGLSYSWDFGDGRTSGQSSDPQAGECYYNSGTYQVTLTVTDTAGQTSSETKPVVVS